MARYDSASRLNLSAAITLAILAGASPVGLSANAAEMQRLRVSMATKSSALYAPYLIAIEKGYYAEEGLELVITVAGGGVSTPAQLAGDIDINTSGPVALTPILRGAPLKIVYTMAVRSTDELWSTSKDLKTLQDLKGRQIGIISRGDSAEIETKMALAKAGLPLDYVNFTALGQATGPGLVLKSGSLPAVVIAGSFLEIARAAGDLEKGNLVYSFFRDLPQPYSGIAVSDQFLKTDRGAVVKFMRATFKGTRFMKANRSGSIAVMSKYDTQSSQDLLGKDYDKVVSVLTPDGTISADVRLADMKVRASIIGLDESKIPPLEKAYDYSIVEEANDSLNKSGWQPKS